MLSALLFLAPLALASSHDNVLRRHKARMPSQEVDLVKKDSYNGRATFFDVGLGACGQYNVASDFMVALNTPQYGYGSPGPECFKMITITYNGKTTGAQIMDECPSCNWGDLDMSRGLFDFFASEDLGEFQMTWWYSDGAPSQPQTTTTPDQPTTTWQPPTTTTSQWQPPTTTSTSTTPTSTSTSTTPTSTSTHSTSSSASSTGSGTSTSATGISLIGSPTTNASGAQQTGGPGISVTVNNENDINQLVVALGNIIAKAPSSS